MKKVSLLIPSRFNNRWILDLNFKTIRKYTTEYPYQIIVGDAGMDDEAIEFVKSQKDVQLVKCPDPIRPKDHLARIVETPYFMFLHDDVQILKHGWLTSRIKLMEKDDRNGIVGVISTNYKNRGKIIKYFFRSPLERRFFPLVMLVKKETQDDLNLCWGIVEKSFDTGGLAYFQFLIQKKWRFVNCKFNHDVKHWGQMTWVLKKRTNTTLNLEGLQKEREYKLTQIKKIIESGDY